jgi:hypothetical protein
MNIRDFNFKNFKIATTSRPIRWALFGAGIFVIMLLVFHAGFVAGSRSHFPFPPGGAMKFQIKALGGEMDMPRGFIPAGHGLVGMIESSGTSSVIVRTRDGLVQKVVISKGTDIRGDATSTDGLTPGVPVVILGEPDEEGTIWAKLIRAMFPREDESRMFMRFNE